MPQNLSVKQIILKLNEKLLALSSRNKLLSSSFSTRSEAFFFIDEIPQKLAEKLSSGTMEFIPLPPLEAESQDEKSKKFINQLSILKLTDETYLNEIEKLQEKDIQDQDEIANLELKYERSLKDRLRSELGLKPLPKSNSDSDLRIHAKNFNLNPTYDLPNPNDNDIDINAKKFNDKKIQTLFLTEALNTRLRKLKNKEVSNLQETGLNTLYVCFGFLEWQESKSSKKRLAPLLLMPVVFDEDRKSFKISSQDGEILDNLTLRLFLKNEFDLKLPNIPKLDPEEDLIDIEKYLSKISNFAAKEKGWRVLRRSSIGIFYTQELAMYEDLKMIAENPNDLLKELFSGKGVESQNEIYDVDDEEINHQVPSLIDSADASQYSAILDALNGKSFVLRGPPGTGKSQTICNIIAAGISNQKKILFIADKEAALEVVRSRLSASGLDKFIMKAYSTKSAKKPFWESVKNRFKLSNIKHSSGEYEETLNKLKNTRDKLNEYRKFISKKYGKSNLTNHDLLWEQQTLEDKYSIDNINKDLKKNLLLPNPDLFSNKDLEDSMNKFTQIENAFDLKFKNHIWKSINKVPSTPIEQKDFREDITMWKNLLINLKDSIQNNKLLKDFQKLLDTEEKTQEVLDSINIIYKHKEDSNNYGLIEKFLKLDADNSHKLIELLNINQERLEKQKLFNKENINVNDLENIIQLCNESANYLHANNNFSDLSKIKEHLILDLDAYKSAVEVVSNTQLLSYNDLNLLINIRNAIEEFDNDTKAMINLNSKVFDKQFITILESFDEYVESIEMLNADSFDFNGITEDANFYQKSSLYLKNSSIFSIFSGEYWNINKHLKYLNRGHTSKTQKIAALEYCYHYLNSYKEFNENNILKELFPYEKNLEEISRNNIKHIIKFCKNIVNLNLKKNINNYIFDEFNNNTNDFFENVEQKITHGLNINENTVKIINNGSNSKDIINNISLSISLLDKLNKDADCLNISDIKFDDIYSKLSEFENYLKATVRLKLELQPLIDNFDHIMNANNMIIIEDLSHINSTHQDLKKLIISNTNNIDDLKDDLTKIHNSYKLSNDKIKKILILLDANPFNENIEKTSLSDFNYLSDQDSQSEDNIITYFEYRSLESSLNETENIFYRVFVNSENFISIVNIKYYFMTWVRYQQYKSLLSIKNHSNILNNYKGKTIEKLKLDLRNLDNKMILLTRSHVAWTAKKLQEYAPPGNYSNRVSEKTESELLEYGVERKTFPRGSVRDHIFRSADALSSYCPCWMMTPSNVSTFIPRKEIFDIVIIDEASQMTPPRALGAIARASQVIVVGDENQLPPTSFFQRTDDTQEEDLDIDVNESILDLAITKWRNPRMLQWHYRSKHEDLIRFQNYFIYDSKLIIPPSTVGTESDELGVKNHYLSDAIYQEGGINDDEAEKIIEILVSHANNFPHKSIGIAVMNNKQMELVEQKKNIELSKSNILSNFIDEWATKDEGLNKFFIKNLEKVQGDERDVIIVGTVYGKLKNQSKPFQRFPTINTSMGHRRLNVITTRARDQLHLVTSLQGSDIHNPQTKGTKFLSEYLNYSQTKKIIESNDSMGLPDSPFEEWAIAQIQSLGFEAIPQVGVRGFKIDIGVKHPNAAGYILGIECDGATYHSGVVARDRDLLRQQLLESFGWNIHRIWSTDWIWNPNETKDKLKFALEESLHRATTNLQ